MLVYTLIISFQLLFNIKTVFNNDHSSNDDNNNKTLFEWFITKIFFIMILFVFNIILGLFVFDTKIKKM